MVSYAGRATPALTLPRALATGGPNSGSQWSPCCRTRRDPTVRSREPMQTPHSRSQSRCPRLGREHPALLALLPRLGGWCLSRLGAKKAREGPENKVGLSLANKDRAAAAVLSGGHFQAHQRRSFNTSHLDRPSVDEYLPANHVGRGGSLRLKNPISMYRYPLPLQREHLPVPLHLAHFTVLVHDPVDSVPLPPQS